MNKFQILLFLSIIGSRATAQIIDPKRTAERNATNRVNNRVDQTIDKGLDKVEEGVGSLFKKKQKKEKQEQNSEEITRSDGEGNTETSPGKTSANKKSGAPSFASYSKFDFVPGEKILYFDNFDRVEVGDFPADFNTDASGEVVKIEGKAEKWLNMTKNGSFIPENIKALPDNCTIEFEIGINGKPSGNMSGFGLFFKTQSNDLFKDTGDGSFLYLHPDHGSTEMYVVQTGKPEITNSQKLDQWNISDKAFVKVAIWKQKGRMRAYVNETKVWDLPRFFPETKPYFLSFNRNFFDDCDLFISNIKFAVGAPDTRNKLLTEGKFVTNGILFDVNSDRIRAESYGVLKEMGQVLSENPTVKVRISGHTDSDGDEKTNLLLSQKRAVAVKEALSKDFGIDATRLETNGFGESKPVDNNSTATGKANNRRVEFTRL